MPSIVSDLNERGLVAQASDLAGLDQHLESGARVVYVGFDPSASSLHVGNLIPLLTLRRFQLAGHRPIALVGGATGLIGDPSGRSDERNLNNESIVGDWVESISDQVSRFLDCSGSNAALVLNNLEWTGTTGLLPFLRDVGKHFSVNAMVQRDSVKTRLARDGSGISFTEFSYMLLQANDYLELAKRHNCTVQIGGSDQWGNITSGLDLVRRVLRRQVFALTFNLLTKSDGTKFGKTAGGSLWLDSKLTSPYAFYQYWMNVADADVHRLLGMFTLLSAQERKELQQQTADRPQDRAAQTTLAKEVTSLVHGEEALNSAQRITAALFKSDVVSLNEQDVDQLWLDGLERVEVVEGTPVFVALSDTGLADSRGAARRLIRSNSVSANGVRIEDENAVLNRSNALFGRYHLLRRGRKSWCIARLSAHASD